MPPLPTLGFVGAGYVGLTSAACFAKLGYPVVLFDINREKIDTLRSGQVPFHEPGLSELLAENRERLLYTTLPSELYDAAGVVFVCVDTPPTFTGDADLSHIWAVIDAIPPQSCCEVLVMKSTVPVGTSVQVRRKLAEKSTIAYASNPEFLREGSAIGDFLHPDRVVIGAFDLVVAERLADLYRSLSAPILVTDPATSEMIKYASNAFLATKISFINEIANVCEEVGADVHQVAKGMGYDPRIGPQFLQAGIGYGGSCFPKDVAALKQIAGNSGYHFQLLSAVIEVNELQKRRVLGKLRKYLGELSGKRIALLGLAFKPGTDDLREATSLVLATQLLALGAQVSAYDPQAGPQAKKLLPTLDVALNAGEAIKGADAVVLVTEWPEFKALDWSMLVSEMNTPLFIDGRNALPEQELRQAGFTYEGIGRSGTGAENENL